MDKPKILAPVGGQEQLLAAVRCGADAVYLGAKGFNARRNAENFEETSLEDAVRYCHECGVLVYVTLNTLVMDDEFDALVDQLDSVAAAQADAVIVQDIGVARLVAERYPSLPLFASTQTTVHNVWGAKLLEELGFSQVVLARELSCGELRSIRASCDIALEFFVHGALCMCMSGACYLSSMIGTRSGNRGLCAQPCRLDFRLGARDHALSLKDMSLIERIGELSDCGVDALKIEGRMKRPEYVAAAVTACRAALASQTPDMDALKAVFSRSGFTDGYFTGLRTADMFGCRTKEDVTSASEVLPALRSLYSSQPQTVPLSFRFTAAAGKNASLYISDGAHEASVSGPVPEPARTSALCADAVMKPLSQTGGTPYFISDASCDIEPGLSLPLSAIKGMRREALHDIANMRISRPAYERTSASVHSLPVHVSPEKPRIRLRFESTAQMFPAPEAERVILPVSELENDPALIGKLGSRLIAEPPSICFPQDAQTLYDALASLRARGLRSVMADNLGMIYLARELGFDIHGDTSLNILNSQTLDAFAAVGLADASISFELSMKGIRALRGTLPRGIVAYGRLTLMKMRACPARSPEGCGNCTGKNVLTDEKKERFPLVCRGRKYTELLNCVPLYIGDKPISGVDFVTLRFTDETAREAQKIYETFIEGRPFEGRRTGGLYFRSLI